MMRQPLFHVRDIPVCGDLILSPMDGFSDLPFRSICRALGSAMSYTEFVSVDEVSVTRNPEARVWRKLRFDPSERPVTIQIYGHEADRLVEVAGRLEALGPDIIDLNMGCWVNSVSGRGAGAGLLRTPDKIGRIFARFTRSLNLPVTGKIRLGWDDASRNYLEVARVLEDNGASLIAVHGRTKAQAYQGQADWDAIAEVKAAVRVPVVGSGDVKCVSDIERMKRHTGVEAVMIGRAAIGNPWIFTRRERRDVPFGEVAAMIRRHLALSLEYYGLQEGFRLFRRHAHKYIFAVPMADALRSALASARRPEEVLATIGAYESGLMATA